MTRLVNKRTVTLHALRVTIEIATFTRKTMIEKQTNVCQIYDKRLALSVMLGKLMTCRLALNDGDVADASFMADGFGTSAAESEMATFPSVCALTKRAGKQRCGYSC